MTAAEGATPLRPAKSFSRRILVKDESRNPTGTFKDRGASAAITRLSQLKIQRVVLASEGNAGCSFALYSQLAGIDCQVYVPKTASPAKVALTKKLGAKLGYVNGTISEAGLKASRVGKVAHRYNASTFVTPFRHDGKGTMALEICQQLGWNSPDYVVYPVGGGVGLIGMWKMFKTLVEIGWIRTKPRFVAVQSAGCAPVVSAHVQGKEDVEACASPHTIASGLKIPKPVAGKWILKSLRESNGAALTVTDTEIKLALRRMLKEEGMILEPSSAAAFAAIPKLLDARKVDQSDTVVVIATGSGLKTTEQL